MTILNPVAGSVGAMIEENIDSDILRTLIDSLLKTIDEELFITKSVREIIFDGYHDPVFDGIEKFKSIIPAKYIPEVTR